jgi:hypothetical protein
MPVVIAQEPDAVLAYLRFRDMCGEKETDRESGEQGRHRNQ